MAEVLLKRRILGDKDYLPKVCLVCGTRPARAKKVTFHYQPNFWLSFLTRITVLRFQKAWVPLCDEHWEYFHSLNLAGLIGALVLVLVVVGAIVGAVTLPDYAPVFAVGGVFLLIVGTVGLFLVQGLTRQGKVRTTQIDDSGMLLVNVAPEFVQALAQRKGEPRRDERDDVPVARGGSTLLFLTLAGGAAAVVLFFSCGVVGLVVFLGTRAPQGRGPDPRGSTNPQVLGRPIDPAWDEKTMTGVYLSDMEEVDPQVGYGKFGKNGMLGYGIAGAANSPITVDGRAYPKGLSTAPPNNGHSSVKYRLGRSAKIFHDRVAINDVDDDHRTGAETPLRFRILGDGKLLWVSAPVQQARTTQECRINVENVDWLELQVECQGSYNSARAVWLEPQVLK